MKERIQNNIIVKTGMRSVMVGLGVYFMLTAVCVLVFWFTGISEDWMTYAGGICLAAGCFASGLKMGSGMGRKGMLTGFAAGIILSLILWGIAGFITNSEALLTFSYIKIAAEILCGAAGGMIGVNK